MNKIVLGIIVLFVGGMIGWYYFRSKPVGPTGPGTTLTSPFPTVSGGAGITITDEQIGAGTQKGGVISTSAVRYSDAGFEPATVTVRTGTTVTFTNDSTAGMWVASAQHPTHQLLPGFDQLRSVSKGGTYTYVFTKTGTWKYHNHVTPEATGVVIVTE